MLSLVVGRSRGGVALDGTEAMVDVRLSSWCD